MVRVGPELAVSAWPEATSAARVEWRADAHFGAEASAAAGLFDSDGGRAEITERIRKVFSSFATALDAELIKKR